MMIVTNQQAKVSALHQTVFPPGIISPFLSNCSNEMFSDITVNHCEDNSILNVFIVPVGKSLC